MGIKTITSQKQNNEPVETNASPSAYGWCFQVGAGISLMLDNLKDFTSMKMEGAFDDIEFTTASGKIYAQAKSVIQMGDQRSATANLKNAMRTLSKDVNNNDAIRLIYVTNIINPFSGQKSSDFQYGRNYDFTILPDEAQTKIRELVNEDFPTKMFQVQIISFFGEGDNKFESIKEKISVFLREAINDPSYNKRLLDSWFEKFMVNASDKPDNEKKLDLKKKDIVLPVIVLVIDPPISEREFMNVCDYDNYNEITQNFREIISQNVYDYEFYSGVLGDFLIKRRLSSNPATYKFEYVRNEWKEYEPQFNTIRNAEVREALIKLLLLTVITQRTKINDIKGAANL
jgi:hypothetical protein